MKKIIYIVSGSLLTLILLGFIALYIWIDLDVQKNIAIAKKNYPGIAEDALIAYLQDTTNSPDNRTHVAVWTLGMIHSEKALPILKDMYKGDSEGVLCKGNHDKVVCQYGISKAIRAIESNGFMYHTRLNK